METILVAYVPVLHRGYIDFFRNKPKDADVLYVVSEDIIEDTASKFSRIDYIKRKDTLRALCPEDMKKAVDALCIFKNVVIMDSIRVKIMGNHTVTFIRKYFNCRWLPTN